MITKSTLEDLRRYRKENPGLLEAEDIIPMFIRGEFNKDNWSGGDDIIRLFTDELQMEFLHESKTYKDIDRILIVTFDNDGSNNVVRMTCISNRGSNIDNYEVGWYKSRGKTDYIKRNGQDITEEQYVELINIIEETSDFRFEKLRDRREHSELVVGEITDPEEIRKLVDTSAHNIGMSMHFTNNTEISLESMKKSMQVQKEANDIIKKLHKQEGTWKQYSTIQNITELEVAKEVISKLARGLK